MALLTILSLWSILVTALRDSRAGSDRTMPKECNQNLVPHSPQLCPPCTPTLAGPVGELLPQDSATAAVFSWGRYQVAVARRKEEPCSSSVYNLNGPWMPTGDLSNFINNETIKGQDLVAWVTAGFLHIPHAEDIPNTVTVGNGVGFFLRPYNFFSEDPSFRSADAVYFREGDDAGACELNPQACLPRVAACAPRLPAFSHGGFLHH